MPVARRAGSAIVETRGRGGRSGAPAAPGSHRVGRTSPDSRRWSAPPALRSALKADTVGAARGAGVVGRTTARSLATQIDPDRLRRVNPRKATFGAAAARRGLAVAGSQAERRTLVGQPSRSSTCPPTLASASRNRVLPVPVCPATIRKPRRIGSSCAITSCR